MRAALGRLALALVVFLGGVVALLSRRDGPPPEDADLMETAPAVAEHENGYITLTAAAELLQWPEDAEQDDQLTSMARGSAWDADLASRLLHDNEIALTTFVRVARNPAYQSAAEPSPGGGETAIGAIRLARLLAIRSRLAVEQARPPAALDDALLALRIGKRIAGDPHQGLLSGYTGIVVGESGLDAVATALPSLELDGASSRLLGRELSALRVDPHAWRGMLAAEYRRQRPALLAADPMAYSASADLEGLENVVAWLPSDYLFQPNNSLTAFAKSVRAHQRRADLPCTSDAGGRPSLGSRDLLRPNALGRRHAAIWARDLERNERQRCAYDTRIELTRAAVAVRAFERERGASPPSLEALVPGYLETAPTDDFSGDELRFDRSQRLLYSVGSDGIDEGGREIENDTESREPRFELPAP